jgi:hypothetical protein
LKQASMHIYYIILAINIGLSSVKEGKKVMLREES